MTRWIVAVVLAAAAQLGALPTRSGIHDLIADVPGVGTVLYGVSVPRGYDPAKAAPLVVVLHPGGERMRYYGSAFTRMVVEPGLRDLKAIMVAPDCPSASWTDAAADKAVMALVESARATYNIDRARILVVGYSMGGRGTWFMSAEHPDVFTAAIPMAASTGDEPLERFGLMPTYVIHSRSDEVVPFAPAERNARTLSRMGRPVHFEALDEFHHFEMVRYVAALSEAGRWIANQWKRK
jgi:predicted peptidase